MADFCHQCSVEMFGKDFNDLANLSTAEDSERDVYAVVICEGCGVIQVDHRGTCISADCLCEHAKME